LATKHTSAGQGWQAITQHPLFATVVPVWLAATFALSTLAIRGQLIERIVLSTQLDLILPMATPPLGTTARLLLAVGFGLMGALIGWVAVRMLTPRNAFAQAAPRSSAAQTGWQQARREAAQDTAPMPRRRADAHPDFPARQPIQAHAELGEHGFDNDPAKQPAKVEHEPAPQVAETTPAPGYAPPPPVSESWQVLHDVLPPPPPAEEPSWDWKPAVAAAAFAAPVEVQPAPQEPVQFVAEPLEPVLDQPFRQFQIDPAPSTAEAAPEAEPALAPKALAGFPSLTLEGPSAAEHIASASLESLSHVELLERLARALQRHQSTVQGVKPMASEQALAPAPDGTGEALRAALASLRDVK